MSARRCIAIGVGVVALAAGALGAWYWTRPPAVAPPMPGEIQDAEVRSAIQTARDRVLEQPVSAGVWGDYGKVLLAHLFDREADVCFAVAARLDPAEPLWPYARGLIAIRREPAAAEAHLRQAWEIANREVHGARAALGWQLAEFLLERGELKEAEEHFRASGRGDLPEPRPAFGLGLIALARGDQAEAARLLTLAGGSPHARKKAAAQLALLARLRGDVNLADRIESDVAKMDADPPWPDPLLDEVIDMQVGRRGRERRASQLERQHRFTDATEVYLEQVAVEPTVAAYVGAGVNLGRLRDYDRAVAMLRKAVELEPDNAHAHYSLGLVLFARAERVAVETPREERLKAWFEQALEHSRRAAQLRPDHGRAYLNWGLALKHLGDRAAAIEPLRRAVACAPADPTIQWALGEALHEIGQDDAAKVHLENAQRLAPDDPRAPALLKRLQRKS